MADQVQGIPTPPPPVGPAVLQVPQAPQQPAAPHMPQQPAVPQVPQQLAGPQAPQQPATQMVHLKWYNFKPEFSGKPDEDAEAHLLHTNDWMNMHHFIEVVRVQRFCLTLSGEAILWYNSLEPIKVDWQGSQNLFRQQYYKIGNTRELLFHAWISFNFNENTETIDTYVTCIRQVGALLGYGELQILEVFKNTLPTKLYWILFPIKDLGKQ